MLLVNCSRNPAKLFNTYRCSALCPGDHSHAGPVLLCPGHMFHIPRAARGGDFQPAPYPVGLCQDDAPRMFNCFSHLEALRRVVTRDKLIWMVGYQVRTQRLIFADVNLLI